MTNEIREIPNPKLEISGTDDITSRTIRIQPTGRFHWGNYFGAIRQYIALQENEQAF